MIYVIVYANFSYYSEPLKLVKALINYMCLYRNHSTVFPNLFFINPRLVLVRCCYENHLSKEFCTTRDINGI